MKSYRKELWFEVPTRRAFINITPDVQKCIDCHKKPGEVPKELKQEWKAKKVKKSEKDILAREYHAEAIHDNCRDCHKKHNKKTKTKDAPTTCAKCHPKEK